MLPQTTGSDQKLVKDEKKSKSRGQILSEIESQLHSLHKFAKDRSRTLYYYKNGVFVPENRSIIGQYIKSILNLRNEFSKWDPKMESHIRESLLIDAPLLPDIPPMNLINCLNGMLDPYTGDLHKHSPSFLSFVQIPIVYDPLADPSVWDQFIQSVFEPDCWDLAYELIGWLIRPNMNLQKAVMLVGEGSNGKSVFLDALHSVLGKHNVSNCSLHKLQSRPFSAVALIGKLANICADLPSKDLEQSDVFKAITGDNVLDAERKYGDTFSFVNFARMIFSANNPPSSKDASHAFYRRWIIIPFNREFTPDSPNYRPKDLIHSELTAPEALSGLLNKAIQSALKLETNRKFSNPESVSELMTEFKEQTNPIHRWFKECAEIKPETFTPKTDVLSSYNSWRARNSYPPVLGSVFFKEFFRFCKESNFSNVDEVRKGPKGSQTRCISSFELKDSNFLQLVS